MVAPQNSETILWHDYETFGRDSTRERPVQFAAIRTDFNLEETGDRTMIYCRQTADYLPDPESCLVHGVLPDTANEKGLSELAFADVIHRLMAAPGTCTSGYNSIRFDDEFTRQLFFRNFFDPYAREWQHNNSRWDLIDVVRLARALRPEGINWPTNTDGSPSNKLELLTDANGISHGDAHDALADVDATIGIARLLKQKQPKLYNYAFKARSKRVVKTLLNLVRKDPVLHVSGMYPSATGQISIVVPLAPHPANSNGTLVYDLRVDPTDLICLSREEIAERLFTPRQQLPDNLTRIAIKTVHANRSPVLAPLATLTSACAQRLQLDVNQALRYREQLIANPAVTEKLSWVFARHDRPHQNDPELTLYSGGFTSDRDRASMQAVHRCRLESKQLPQDMPFEDARFDELLFRLRARNEPEHLSNDDKQRWHEFCHRRVHLGEDNFRSISDYQDALQRVQATMQDHGTPNTIDSLRRYGQAIAALSAQP